MRCGSSGSGVYRKSLFINASVLVLAALLVPSQVMDDADKAGTFIPVIEMLRLGQWDKYNPDGVCLTAPPRDIYASANTTRG